MEMNSTPIFSIIVPVYNVEPYLEKCLASVAKQSLENIEVIIIYDKSNDESYNICVKYLSKYSNFKLYLGTKKGVGAARNIGINNANGKYISFVDSDDWIEPNLCSDMFSVMEKTGADFINFGLDFVNKNEKVLFSRGKFTLSKLQGEDIFRKSLLDDNIFTVVWNKIYRRSFLIENQIFFPEVKEWEDILYSRQIAYFSNSTNFVSKVYYHALVRDDSRSRTITTDFLLNGLSLLNLEHQFISKIPNGSVFENLYRAHFIKHISFYLIKAAFQIKSWHEYLNCFNLIEKSDYSTYIKQSEVKVLLSSKNRIMIFACKFPKSLRIISFFLKKIGKSPY